jgi:hypothetical protein
MALFYGKVTIWPEFWNYLHGFRVAVSAWFFVEKKIKTPVFPIGSSSFSR